MSVIPSIVVVESVLAQEGAKADITVLERHDQRVVRLVGRMDEEDQVRHLDSETAKKNKSVWASNA